MTISEQAELALQALDDGARMNCLHTIARELISAGLAANAWGVLEITEAGRRFTRRKSIRTFPIADHADVADLSRPPVPPELVLPPLPRRPIPPEGWSRERAMRAAGEANGACETWVDQRWVTAFLDAYEALV